MKGLLFLGLAGAGLYLYDRNRRNRASSGTSSEPRVWLYHVQPIMENPLGAGPFHVFVAKKWEKTDKGWSFAQIPGTYMSRQGAEDAAKEYIVKQGGTPELFT